MQARVPSLAIFMAVISMTACRVGNTVLVPVTGYGQVPAQLGPATGAECVEGHVLAGAPVPTALEGAIVTFAVAEGPSLGETTSDRTGAFHWCAATPLRRSYPPDERLRIRVTHPNHETAMATLEVKALYEKRRVNFALKRVEATQ